MNVNHSHLYAHLQLLLAHAVKLEQRHERGGQGRVDEQRHDHKPSGVDGDLSFHTLQKYA